MTTTRTNLPVARGARVEVTEANIRPWGGVVRSAKWSPKSGWWIDVERDGGGTWVVPQDRCRQLEEGE